MNWLQHERPKTGPPQNEPPQNGRPKTDPKTDPPKWTPKLGPPKVDVLWAAFLAFSLNTTSKKSAQASIGSPKISLTLDPTNPRCEGPSWVLVQRNRLFGPFDAGNQQDSTRADQIRRTRAPLAYDQTSRIDDR